MRTECQCPSTPRRRCSISHGFPDAAPLLPRVPESADIVRMHGGRPPGVGALLLCETDQLEKRRAGVGVAALRRADPRAVVDRVAEGLVPEVALAKRGLRRLPGRDILDSGHEAPRRPSLVSNQGRRRPAPRRPNHYGEGTASRGYTREAPREAHAAKSVRVSSMSSRCVMSRNVLARSSASE